MREFFNLKRNIKTLKRIKKICSNHIFFFPFKHMNNKNTPKINFQHVYYKKFIIAKEVYYYKKFITKSKGERKNLSEIYKQQGKRQG